MTDPYELGTAPSARRALADRLPAEITVAAVEFITGPLLANPHRVGKRLSEELAGIYSARVGGSWRVLYEVDDTRRAVTVLDIRHRRRAQLLQDNANVARRTQAKVRGQVDRDTILTALDQGRGERAEFWRQTREALAQHPDAPALDPAWERSVGDGLERD